VAHALNIEDDKITVGQATERGNYPTDKIGLLSYSVQKSEGTETRIFPESYTRLIIENTLIPQSPAPNAPRNGFDRFFSSKNISLTASLSTETGRFKDVTPLLFRKYESGRTKGENFSKEITFDDRQFPLFLVTGDPASQIAKFMLDVKSNNQPTTDITAMSIDFLSNALKAVSPTSSVVTSLTSESADKVAAKVDEGLGKFFSKSVSEKSRFDVDLYRYKPTILSVFGSKTEENDLYPTHIIGQWKISFAVPRPSIFSSVECTEDAATKACASDSKTKAFNDATRRPNTVLSFTLIDKIGNLGTVIGYLKQQDWWATDLGLLGSTKNYGSFCRKIRGAMGEIGLSEVDGRIIGYSVSQSGSVTDAIKIGMLNHDDCRLPG
jgi:hypothetical protein